MRGIHTHERCLAQAGVPAELITEIAAAIIPLADDIVSRGL